MLYASPKNLRNTLINLIYLFVTSKEIWKIELKIIYICNWQGWQLLKFSQLKLNTMAIKKEKDQGVKEPTPIKATLFRFATLRSPQLISEEKKEWGFIHHPDPSLSFFLKEVKTGDIDEAREIVSSLTKTFPASLKYPSVGEIRKKYKSLYRFSMWLSVNKNTITKTDIDANIPTGKIFSDSDLINTWDNVFDQLLTCKNHTIRATCIQLIAAYNFISVYNNASLKSIAEKMIQTPKDPLPPAIEKRLDMFMRRVANAKLIIPEPFSVKRFDTGDTTGPFGASLRLCL